MNFARILKTKILTKLLALAVTISLAAVLWPIAGLDAYDPETSTNGDVRITVTSEAPSNLSQIGKSASQVNFLKVKVDNLSATSSYKWSDLIVTYTGQASADIATDGVNLHLDDGDGVFETDGSDAIIFERSLSAGAASFAMDGANVTIAALGSKTYFVSLDTVAAPTNNDTVGIRVSQGNMTFINQTNAEYVTDLPKAHRIGPTGAIDSQVPTITLAETGDRDANGKIDYYKITFSENIDDSSINGYTTANAEISTSATHGFAVAGYEDNNIYLGTSAAVASLPADIVDDNILYLGFTEPGTFDTSAKPELTYTAATGSLDDLASPANALANVANGDLAETDKAAPVVLLTNAATKSNPNTPTANGYTLNITIKYSEDISISTSDKLEFTVLNTANAPVTISASSETTDTLTLTLAQSSPNNTDQMSVAYSGTSITDGINAATTTFLDTHITDDVDPYIIGSEYRDETGDGTVDQVRLTFSEPITYSAFENGDWTETANGITGLDVTDGTATASTTLNLTASANAGITGGTAPTLQYVVQGATNVTDGTNTLAGVTKTLTDAAAPVALLTNAATKSNPNAPTANGYTKNITIKYSEDISASAPSSTEFAVQNTANAVATVSSATVSTDTLTLVLAQSSPNNTDQMSVAYTGTSITDGTTAAVAFLDAHIIDAVVPVVTGQTYKDAGADGSVDRLELVFSEIVTWNGSDLTQFAATANDLTAFAGNPSAVSGSETNTLTLTMAATTNLTGVGAAGTEPTYAYTEGEEANRVKDNAGTPNELSNFTGISITDGAAPLLSSTVNAGIKDVDTDGKIDRIDIAFTEDLIDTTSTTPWTLSGTIPSGGTFSSVSESAGVISLNITEGVGLEDTSLPETFSISSFDNTAGQIADAAGNVFDDDTSIEIGVPLDDIASPVLIAAYAGNKGPIAGVMNDAGDVIKLVFSEALADPTAVKASHEIDFVFGGGATDGNNFSTSTEAFRVARTTTNAANDTLLYTFVTGDTSSTNTITPGTHTIDVNVGSVVANSIEDAIGLDLVETKTQEFLPLTSLDVEPPAFSKAEAVSSTAIEITFAEPITVVGSPDWGTVVTATGMTATGGSVAGSVLTVAVNDLNNPAFSPTNLAISAGTVEDATGNDNEAMSSKTIVDKQVPTLVSAKFTDLTHLEMTFSENMGLAATVDETKITITNNAGEAVAVTDNTAVISTTKVTVTTASVVNTNFSVSTGGQGLDLAAGAVQDLAAVANVNVEDLNNAVADGIAPTFVSAVATSDINVRITFSEAVTVTTANGSDFTGEITASAAVINADPTKVDVAVTSLGSTSFTSSNLDIALDAVKDIASPATNGIAETLNQNITDGQVPVIITATLKDRDADGKIDAVDLVFSESITDASVSSTKWTIGGQTATDYITTVGVDADANDANIEIQYDTDDLATSTAANAAAVIFTSGDSITDAASPANYLAANSSITELDGAAPVPVSASSSRAVLSGELPTATVLTISFSEPITVTPGSLDVVNNSGNDTGNDTSVYFKPTGAAADYVIANLTDETARFADGAGTTMIITSDGATGVSWTAGALFNLNSATVAAIVDASSTAAVPAVADVGISGLLDTTAPEVSSISTMDDNGDGVLDMIKVVLNEKVDDSTYDQTKWTMSNMTATTLASSTDVVAGDTADDETIHIRVTSGSSTDTGYIPDVTATASGIQDLSSNPLGTVVSGTITETDGAKPVIMSAVTVDSNRNGTVDQVILTFSEQVDVTDGGTDDDITFVASSGTAVIIAGTYTAADTTTLTYNVTASATGNTAITITPTYATGGSGSIKDNAVGTPNEMANNETVAGVDGAAPVIIAVANYDNATVDGTNDEVYITFSEVLEANATLAGHLGTVAYGGSTGTISLKTADTNQTDVDGDQYITLEQNNNTGGFGNTDVNQLVFSGATIADRVAGTPNVFTAQTVLAAGDTVATVTDAATPLLMSSSCADTEPDGKINTCTLTYSETLTTQAVTIFSAKGRADGDVTVSSAAASGTDVTVTLDNTDSDNWTGIIKITYTAGNGITDGTNNAASLADEALTDNVAPALMGSSMADTGNNGTVDTITLTYSENLTEVTGAVVTAKNKTTGEAIDVTSTTIPGSAATLTVNLNASDPDNYTGVIQLTYANSQTNKIKDAADPANNAPSFADYDATDGVAPALMSAAPSSASTVTAVFSEPLLASSVERTDFDITTITGTIIRAVASGSTAIITLPAGVNAWNLIGQTFSLVAAQTVTDENSNDLTGLKTKVIGSATTSLVSIDVTPNTPTIRKGDTLQFTAIGTYSDGSTADITTSSVVWTSSNTNAATINATSGVATGILENQSTVITATKSGVSGTETLTIGDTTLESIAVTPATVDVAKGAAQQFTAIGTYSNETTKNITNSVVWTSSAAGVATISAAGLATAVAASGTTTITATLVGVTSTAVLTALPATVASVAITPANPTIAKGATQQFVATATYTDGTTSTAGITWTSSNTGVAEIDAATGLAISTTQGSTEITATKDSKSGTATLTVGTPTWTSIEIIDVDSDADSLSIGDWLMFQAWGTKSDGTKENITDRAEWISSATSVASFETYYMAMAQTETLYARAAGTTTITAKLDGTTSNEIIATVLAASETPTVTDPSEAITTNASTYTITGTSAADAYIYVYGSSDSSSTYADGDGAWSVEVELNTNQANSFTVYAREEGKGRSAVVAVPTITQDDNSPSVMIISPTGNTNDTTPLLSYEAEAGTTIVVKIDGTATSTRTGQSFGELIPGSHTVIVEATDAAGNMGSSNSNFTIDTSVPGSLSANPSSGIYNETKTVLLENGNGTIYYTTNGSTPSTSSAVYTAAGITVSSDTVLKAVCLNSSGTLGSVSTFTYVIKTDLDGTATQTIVLKSNQWNIFSVPKLVTSFIANTTPTTTSLTGLVGRLGAGGAAYLIEGNTWKNLTTNVIASSSHAHYGLEVPQPLYGYVMKNMSGADITLTITYDTTLASGITTFQRNLAQGWNSVGVADYLGALTANSTTTELNVDTSDGIGGLSPAVLGYVLDYAANANNSSVNFAGTARLRQSGSSGTINIINPRETRGYLISSQAGSFVGTQIVIP